MLSVIQSPTLLAITVTITPPILMQEKDDEISLPENDWKGVDAMVCDLLSRIRRRAQNTLWTFGTRLTGWKIPTLWLLPIKPPEIETPLADFRNIGGLVVLLT